MLLIFTIGCKWVYKRKKRVNKNIETYKARLTTKDYSQKPGFNYEETFSSIVIFKSIEVLLSITTYLDYKIRQMDIKIRILNDYVNKSIYMI